MVYISNTMPSAEQKYKRARLGRALTIIELLNEKPSGLSVNEISAELNFPVNSVYRIMSTLERRKLRGQANQETQLRSFRKTSGTRNPGGRRRFLYRKRHPSRKLAADLTKESMLTGVMLGNEGVVSLEQVEGLHNFSFKVNLGLGSPYIRRPLAKHFWLSWEKKREEVINSLVLKKNLLPTR